MAKKTHFRKPKRIIPPPKRVRSKPGSSILFYFSLGKNALLIFFTPLRKLLKLSLLLISLWLGMGAITFGLAYFKYREMYFYAMRQRESLEKRAAVWQDILKEHPTARDPLLGAYSLALGLGQDQQAKVYLDLLRRIDPNNPGVKSLR